MRALLLPVVLLAAPACTSSSDAQPLPAHAATPAVFDYTVADRLRDDGEPYLLHRWRVPLARARIDVVDMQMRTDLDRALAARRAALVVNGGYYGTDGRAEGLVIVRGRRRSPLLPRIRGGIIAVTRGGRAVHVAPDRRALPRRVDFAIQCSPRLVANGQSAIERVGEDTASRTALCLRDAGRVLDVYVARVDPSRGRAGPTLYAFARELVAEGCDEALNLDGGPSTGVAWRGPDGPQALLPRRGIRHALVFTVE